MLFALIFITVLGCGLVAGFFAFSTFVTKALGELLPSKGILALAATAYLSLLLSSSDQAD